MTPNSMLPWPDEPYLTAPRMQWLDYERARVEAALSRLRIAVEALKVVEQARLEVRHAKEVGPGWYTRGEHGMHRQVLMWDGKAGEAAAKALAEIGEIPQS